MTPAPRTIESVLAGTCRWAVAVGDALTSLKRMPDDSVNMVVTSPPYYGLRDYGTGKWVGGTKGCDHKTGRQTSRVTAKTKAGGGTATAANFTRWNRCGKCGAVRKDEQIGLEDSPAEFIDRLTLVFAEVRRVLRPDGCCFINIGDSYANDAPGKADKGSRLEGRANVKVPGKTWRGGNLKKKDRIGIPPMLAFALRDEGWWWRDEIVWHKPNPLTESVRDRTTRSHEMLYLFTKSARYWYDADAIKERAAYAGKSRGGSSNRYEQNAAGMDSKVYDDRNKRSVWKVAPERRHTKKGQKHFAVMPSKLVEPCILAGCPLDGVVLDPFAGSGTTLDVAVRHGRRAIGLELNPQYAALIPARMAAVQPVLVDASRG